MNLFVYGEDRSDMVKAAREGIRLDLGHGAYN